MWPTALHDAMERAAIEKGMKVSGERERVKLRAPTGYVPFAKKAERARRQGMEVPQDWVDGTGIDEGVLSRLMMFPIGIRHLPCLDPSMTAMCGAGWYPLVVVKLRRSFRDPTTGNFEMVTFIGAWCKEQILNAIGELEGCGLERLLNAEHFGDLFDDSEEGNWVEPDQFFEAGETDPAGWVYPDITWTEEWYELYTQGWRYYPDSGWWQHIDGTWDQNPSPTPR